MVYFTYPSGGLFEVSVNFKGTFLGKAGLVRGSPFRVNVLAEGDSLSNEVSHSYPSIFCLDIIMLTLSSLAEWTVDDGVHSQAD